MLVDLLIFGAIIAAAFGVAAWLMTESTRLPAAARLFAMFAASVFFVLGAREWGAELQNDAFVLLKTTLIYGPLVAVFSRRFAAWAPRALIYGAPLFVAFNMLAAIGFDASNGRYVNAIAGCVLIATMTRRGELPAEWDRVGPFRLPMHWRVDRLWIVAYTVWDTAFVVGFYPGFYTFGLLFHLALPLALAWSRPERWLAFRGVFLAVAFTAWDASVWLVGEATTLQVFFDIRTPAAMPVHHVVSVLALVLAAATAIRAVARRGRASSSDPASGSE